MSRIEDGCSCMIFNSVFFFLGALRFRATSLFLRTIQTANDGYLLEPLARIENFVLIDTKSSYNNSCALHRRCWQGEGCISLLLLSIKWTPRSTALASHSKWLMPRTATSLKTWQNVLLRGPLGPHPWSYYRHGQSMIAVCYIQHLSTISKRILQVKSATSVPCHWLKLSGNPKRALCYATFAPTCIYECYAPPIPSSLHCE